MSCLCSQLLGWHRPWGLEWNGAVLGMASSPFAPALTLDELEKHHLVLPRGVMQLQLQMELQQLLSDCYMLAFKYDTGLARRAVPHTLTGTGDEVPSLR